MKEKLKVLTMKMESTYNTDPVPTAAANVLLAENIEINPLEMDTDDFAPAIARFGQDEKIVGATWASLNFDMLLCGGGTPVGNASNAPNSDCVLRASGLARTVTAATSIGYDPIDTGEESAASYYFNDGVLHKMTGIRGDFSLEFGARKAPRLMFKGLGLNQPMTDVTLPTPTLPTVPRPRAVNQSNTTLSIGGYAARLSAFTINLGNDVQYRNLTGRRDIIIADRNMSGKVTVELPLVAEKDFLGASGLCTLGTTSAMTVTHGTSAGNIVTMTLGAVQLLKPKPKGEAGVLMLECDLHIVRNGFSLVFT